MLVWDQLLFRFARLSLAVTGGVLVAGRPEPSRWAHPGPLPQGWAVRLDGTSATENRDGGTLEITGGALHAQSPGAAIYYLTAKNMMAVPADRHFAIEATFANADPADTTGYGLVLGGLGLDSASARYLLLELEPRTLRLKLSSVDARRKAPQKEIEWFPGPVVHNRDPNGQPCRCNHLQLEVRNDSVSVALNGTVVRELALSEVFIGAGQTSGAIGIHFGGIARWTVTDFAFNRWSH